MNYIAKPLNWKDTNFKANTPNTIVIHHAAASSCSIEDIHKWHLARGWKGIAYHYFIRKDGSVYIGRLEIQQGGHLLGDENKDTIGICLEGDYNKEKEIPGAQFQALILLCQDIEKRWSIKQYAEHSDFPSAKVNGKICPGKWFPWNAFILAMTPKKDWKVEGVEKLHQYGLLNDPDYWKTQIDAPMPVWAVTLLIERIYSILNGGQENE